MTQSVLSVTCPVVTTHEIGLGGAGVQGSAMSTELSFAECSVPRAALGPPAHLGAYVGGRGTGTGRGLGLSRIHPLKRKGDVNSD
jgi:hypothetical protein